MMFIRNELHIDSVADLLNILPFDPVLRVGRALLGRSLYKWLRHGRRVGGVGVMKRWLGLFALGLVSTSMIVSCKARNAQSEVLATSVATAPAEDAIHRLLALGYDESVARRMVTRRPDILAKVLNSPDDEARPRISFRGIGTTPIGYDPTRRTGGYSYDGIYTAKDYRYSLRYMDDTNGYAILLEFQTPNFLAEVHPPAEAVDFLDGTEILLPTSSYPDDRDLLKCFGVKKRGVYNNADRLTLKAIYWFSYDQAFDESGKFRAKVLDGWGGTKGDRPMVETAVNCVHSVPN